MDCYIVWYRAEGEEVDRVRGVSRNWKRAEDMANSLRLWLKIEKHTNIIVGVKRGEHGKLYDDEDLSLRWTVKLQENLDD